jgi:hypothetical protein
MATSLRVTSPLPTLNGCWRNAQTSPGWRRDAKLFSDLRVHWCGFVDQYKSWFRAPTRAEDSMTATQEHTTPWIEQHPLFISGENGYHTYSRKVHASLSEPLAMAAAPTPSGAPACP